MSEAYKILASKELADEVVQEAFLYLMTALPDLESELDARRFLKWKTRMLALDQLRGRHSYGKSGSPSFSPPALDNLPGGEEPDQRLIMAEEAAIVQLAFSKLTYRQQLVLSRTALEGKSNEEVAEELRITPEGVRALTYRSRKSLREHLVVIAAEKGVSLRDLLLPRSSRSKSLLIATISSCVLLGGFLVSGANAPFQPSDRLNAESSRDFRVPFPAPTRAEKSLKSLELPLPFSSNSVTEENGPSDQVDPDDSISSKNLAFADTSRIAMSDGEIEGDSPGAQENTLVEDETQIASLFLSQDLRELANKWSPNLSAEQFSLSTHSPEGSGTEVLVSSGLGLDLAFQLDADLENLSQTLMTLSLGNGKIVALVPSLVVTSSSPGEDAQDRFLTAIMADLVVADLQGDFGNVVLGDTAFQEKFLHLELQTDATGGVKLKALEFRGTSS